MAEKHPEKSKTGALGDTAPQEDLTLTNPLWERPMTPRQLAKFLQVSPSTVQRQLNAGLPHVRVAGQIRFIPKEVLQHYRRKNRE